MDKRAFYIFQCSKLTVLGAAGYLIYFSLATQTGTGYGDIFPTEWYSKIAVIIHMLISFLYSVIILALGIEHVITFLPKLDLNRRSSFVNSFNLRSGDNSHNINDSARMDESSSRDRLGIGIGLIAEEKGARLSALRKPNLVGADGFDSPVEEPGTRPAVIISSS
mmetsp:Transcript_20582/g.30799  ORF Transcript_20582/g.30799 Transcript_20582/m.30799 type:complete len:165 (+) Transcript_20582:1-495(+)